MDRDDLGFGPDKLFQILQVTNNDIVFRVLAQQ